MVEAVESEPKAIPDSLGPGDLEEVSIREIVGDVDELSDKEAKKLVGWLSEEIVGIKELRDEEVIRLSRERKEVLGAKTVDRGRIEEISDEIVKVRGAYTARIKELSEFRRNIVESKGWSKT